ncbi:MAG TPA: glucuronate isomerase [Anaerolineae bacterium]|nr:glucuronate isomerase [Anaerolineae bacterium]HOQ97918.1 glucuronate isomerase [Anaerolineae bacterium]HPL27638.1 glucuronate isomerase [Anaerolineae bacterium]
MANEVRDREVLRAVVQAQVERTPALDVHTHIYSSAFGPLLLRGPEELLTYHYLQAETNRVLAEHSPAAFMALPKAEQARLVWRTLFVERSPLSEAGRGVITALHRLGVASVRDYAAALARFAGLSAGEHVDLVLRAANVGGVVMTNDPLNPAERAVWEQGGARDARFRAALRIDPILVDWPAAAPRLFELGYAVERDLPEASYPEIARFLRDWAARMQPAYLAASLPPTFAMPSDTACGRILTRAVLPVCRELALPFAMMIGVKKRIMPELGDGGDGVGRADLDAVEHLCRSYPANLFLLTVLARENQHQAVVLARKFKNLHLFGCWWFNNNPSIVEEITRERIEMLGTSFTPQHSDARVLDQLVYKWAHARRVIAAVLVEKYSLLIDEGWYPAEEEITRDVALLMGGEFERFLAQH